MTIDISEHAPDTSPDTPGRFVTIEGIDRAGKSTLAGMPADPFPPVRLSGRFHARARALQKSSLGVRVSPSWPLVRREYPGIEGVLLSNEGKMPSIPALPARSSAPMPTFEEL